MATSITRLQANRLFNHKLTPFKQAWVENFIAKERKLCGIVELNPRVFGVFPRIDHLSETVKWQLTYRNINWVSMPTRNELPGGVLKPWPQKGSGRARHGSVNSPIFLKGGWARGPRGPTTLFKTKPLHQLTNAMRQILSIKLAQNDIKVVDTLADYENEDPRVLEQQLANRGWGSSVLIVDNDVDSFPNALVKSSESIYHVNLMPLVGLNALSLCKHETLVITLDALRKVEEKILFQLFRVDFSNCKDRYKVPKLPD